MKPSEFAALLPGRKTGEGQWQKVCPAHDDKTASLRVTAGRDGRILIHCFAFCGAADVVEAMGLKLADLFPEPLEPGRLRRREPRPPRPPRRSIDRSKLSPKQLEALDKLEAIAKRIRRHDRMQRLADKVGWWMAMEWKGPRASREDHRRQRDAELLNHLSPEQRTSLESWIAELKSSPGEMDAIG